MRTRVRRAYDAPASSDGFRILIDRLWPRGVSKQRARIDLWAKELAPSDALRRWFHADPEARYGEFKKRYRAELAARRAEIKDLLPVRASVTLVTAAKDVARSHVPVVQAFLEKL
jgi:uncharacterized protein YeaO (DUF488 family)